MLPTFFTYFYDRSQIHQTIHDTVHKIHHHQSIRMKGQLKYHLDFVICDDSITITIEDDSGTSTYLIDNFNDYMTILKDMT